MLTTTTKGYGKRAPVRVQASAGPSAGVSAGKAGSRRSCVGCGQRVALDKARAELMRLVLVPVEGQGAKGQHAGYRVVVDLVGRSTGRGAWLHTRTECVERAVKKGLARAAKGRVHTSVPALHQAICEAAERRADGLLSAAWRARALLAGGTVVQEAMAADKVELMLVARDAAAAARSGVVRAGQARGLALAWSSKHHLGDVLGRRDVAVVAVTDAGLAGALRAVIGCWETFASEHDRTSEHDRAGHPSDELIAAERDEAATSCSDEGWKRV